MSEKVNGIDPSVAPSGTGCVECLAANSWWFHLRRCAQCGHIGCCDQSLGKHATAHFDQTGHPVIASFEPGEAWFYNYRSEEFMPGPHLAPPHSHPKDQPTPGPQGGVPADWESQLE
ncbi:MAG TPA: UBP-type zinc finger domain-containing protein [Candidatus Cybelea sp.]|nr:UBP-type zinc finger domain-containing protein [Candidatus Cybelea sp.]